MQPSRQAYDSDHWLKSRIDRLWFSETSIFLPIILVHGFGVNQEHEWVVTGVLPNLACDYRVMAIDVRGFGKSDKPVVRHYSVGA